MGQIVLLQSFYNDGFGIEYLTKVDMSLKVNILHFTRGNTVTKHVFFQLLNNLLNPEEFLLLELF